MSALLSICIPTYNRANLLKANLNSIINQVQESQGIVELVISDNASTDDTRNVIEAAQLIAPVSYHRNDTNIGVIRNIFKVVQQAQGEYCWLLGDDDMLRPGAVAKVVEVLKSHPDLDFVYVNYSIDTFDRREGKSLTAADFSEWTRTANARLDDHRVDDWQQLVAEDFNSLGAIYSSVFRRSVWAAVAPHLEIGQEFSSALTSYPHAVVFAKTMVGKPAFAIGYPWVIMCGTESWVEFYPAAVLLRWHDLLDVLSENGVGEECLDHHRRRMLTLSDTYLTDILCGKRASRLESFSVMKFLIRHRRYPEAWRAVRLALSAAPIEIVFRKSFLYAPAAAAAKLLYRCQVVINKVRARLNSGSDSDQLAEG